MRAIFVDLDGTMAPHEPFWTTRDGYSEYENLNANLFPTAMDALWRILREEPEATVVITSTRRHSLTLSQWQALLASADKSCPVIAVTPSIQGSPHADRWSQISAWLKAHPEITQYVVVDDDCSGRVPASRLVAVDCDSGFGDEDATRALAALNFNGGG